MTSWRSSSTRPETVWGHYGFTPEQVARGDFNPQMFNSFLDGTKSALEMTAVSNACALTPPADGLSFPPCGVDDLPSVLRPVEDGGILKARGTVEVVSSLERDGRPVFRDLRWGVYAVFEAPTPYVRGADVVAVAKRSLKAGDMLDGEGEFTVFGKVVPAGTSLELGAGPIGLAHKLTLLKEVAAGQPVR